jgi:hypothetical protein
MATNLRRPLRLPPALKHFHKVAKPVLEVMQRGAIIGGPGIIARRLPDGRIKLQSK